MSKYEDGLAQGRAEGVEAVQAIWKRWEDLARDRDEWKTQHENLLAMYQTAIATIHALKCRISDAQQAQPAPQGCHAKFEAWAKETYGIKNFAMIEGQDKYEEQTVHYLYRAFEGGLNAQQAQPAQKPCANQMREAGKPSPRTCPTCGLGPCSIAQQAQQAQQAQPAPDVKKMVDRFLAWPLPKSVRTDGCASDPDYPHRIGTHLLNADEAKVMFEHCLEVNAQPAVDITSLLVASLDALLRHAEQGLLTGPKQINDARHALSLAMNAQQAQPAGYKLVPVEPTGEMWSESRTEFIRYAQQWKDATTSDAASIIADVAGAEIYRAMIAAAPKHAQQAQPADEELTRLRNIARLIGSIFVHGDFKAETYNERELEKLLREQGTFYETLADYDAQQAQPADAQVDWLNKQVAAKQAEIDRLMWEFCPNEMTMAQKGEWAKHQVRSDFQINDPQS